MEKENKKEKELSNVIFVARTIGKGKTIQVSIPEEICEFASIKENYLVKLQVLESKPSFKERKGGRRK
jgi:hypothetical protein